MNEFVKYRCIEEKDTIRRRCPSLMRTSHEMPEGYQVPGERGFIIKQLRWGKLTTDLNILQTIGQWGRDQWGETSAVWGISVRPALNIGTSMHLEMRHPRENYMCDYFPRHEKRLNDPSKWMSCFHDQTWKQLQLHNYLYKQVKSTRTINAGIYLQVYMLCKEVKSWSPRLEIPRCTAAPGVSKSLKTI